MDKEMLVNELYLMNKGVRDCCETTIYGTPDEISEKLRDIAEICIDYNYHAVSFLLEKEEDREYRAVFICKYNYQKILLTKLFNDIKPHSFEYEYMMGTLLGYSAASMEEFLMRKCTDEFASITEYDAEEKEASPIKNQLSEFDKDAWQVLMSLHSTAPDSDKLNALTDLLYTETDDSKEENLIRDLSAVMPNKNKPNFSSCIRVLEKYFHVDTENEKTDTSSDHRINMRFFGNDLWDLLDGFKACPSGYDHNLKRTKEFADNYWGKFDNNSPHGKLIKNLAIVLFSSENSARKSEIISNMLEKFYAKYHTEEKKSDIVIDTVMNGSGDSKEILTAKQYFSRAAGLYVFLTVAASMTPDTLPEDEQLDHIKKFIEIIHPQSLSETELYNDIKRTYYNIFLSRERKISAIKDILHTYLFHKKKVADKAETEQKGNTNESIDPYRQAVLKLYRDLKHTKTESEFVAILNKFLEKEACYKGYKAFEQSLRWEIDNEYGKFPGFSSNVLKRIKIFIHLGH